MMKLNRLWIVLQCVAFASAFGACTRHADETVPPANEQTQTQPQQNPPGAAEPESQLHKKNTDCTGLTEEQCRKLKESGNDVKNSAKQGANDVGNSAQKGANDVNNDVQDATK